MAAKPKISVIIPVYMVEPYIRQCLDSIINQTYTNLEIITVDDGSPDRCGEICDEYARKDKRINVIHKQNEGLCAARNDGIKAATGEWITFVDSDDWCELDYYERMVNALDCETVDVLFTGGNIVEFSQRAINSYSFPEPFYYEDRNSINQLVIGTMASPYLKVTKGSTTFGSPWDKLYNTAFIRNNGLHFDVSSKAWEDIWFNFQAFNKAKTVKGCMCIGYHYRQLNTSIVNKFNTEKPKINYDFISKIYSYIDEQKLPRDISEAVEARAIRMILNSLSCYYFHHSNKKSKQEIKVELREMKQWPYFQQAIWSRCNKYLTFKQIVLKYALRLPWIWPVKLLYSAHQKYLATIGKAVVGS